MSTLLTASSSPTSDDKFVDDSFQAIDHPNGALPSVPPSAVWLKMDLIVLPVISMMYFLSSLVRSHTGVHSYPIGFDITLRRFSFPV